MLYESCPRCNGDMYLEEDADFDELVCIQCGHRQIIWSFYDGGQRGRPLRPRGRGSGG
ncbi:hypothetical protein HRbin25_00319 [bacterium HR25]|nr:hypothetical protein HRbin25_00319 [bacterium HR25]